MADIVVPALGESVTEATVASWMKQPGDTVSKDEPVVELETDKVTLEVSAPEDGVMDEIVAAEGDTVEIGALLGRVSGNGAAPADRAKPEAPAAGATSSDAAASSAAAPAASGASGETIDIAIPQMGESVAEGTIGSWLVKVGDTVSVDQPLVEVETDKVAVEVPAPQAGTIAALVVGEGDTVTVGSVIARLTTGDAPAAAPASSPAPKAAPAPAPTANAGSSAGRAMPAARRVIAENGLDASGVQGSGRGGRITKADALRVLDERAAAPAAGSAAKPPARPESTPLRELGPREERVRMTRLRQTIARRLKEAQNSAAMLTTFNDVDMTAIIATRKKFKENFEKKHGVKLGFMGFFVKAVIQALKDIPSVNAEIDGDSIIYKNYYDIGVAVGTDRGLVVPVVRDADQLSLGGVERAVGELGLKARDNALTLEDMQGASFTISNGGVYGSLMSTPILNAPQSGILGMHRIEERPVVVDGQVVARPMMYLALTYDHRIVDGKEAVTFLVRVKECIEDPERLVLDL